MLGTKRQNGKGMIDMKSILYIALVPIILMVVIMAYGYFESSTPQAFYRDVTGDSVNLSSNNTYVAVSTCEQGLVNDSSYDIVVSNSTTTLTESTDYQVDYDNCKIKTINNKTGVYDVDYTYKNEGYASYESTNTQTYNAFNMATVIPIVVISVIVIGLLLKSFVF